MLYCRYFLSIDKVMGDTFEKKLWLLLSAGNIDKKLPVVFGNM